MTAKPIAVGPEASIREVLQVMSERRFRHMPIVDKDGRLIGLVSQRDLSMALRSTPRESELDTPMSELLHPEVDTVYAERCAAEAARHMLRTKRSCLPVVDTEGKLVGLLTEADYLRLATRGMPSCTCGGVNTGNARELSPGGVSR